MLRFWVSFVKNECQTCKSITKGQSEIILANSSKEAERIFGERHPNRTILKVHQLITDCIWCGEPLYNGCDC